MSENSANPRKTVRVECPGCKGLLVVDAETGVVVNYQEHKKEHQSLDDFFAKQKSRSADLEAKMKAGAEREKNRREELEKKFQAAKDNKDLKDPPPGIQWD
jgi:hypothetical protein